jgi:hypothetical protein
MGNVVLDSGYLPKKEFIFNKNRNTKNKGKKNVKRRSNGSMVWR